jgi:hypothetical protein
MATLKTLKNWSIITDPRNPYLAPECRGLCLQGRRPEDTDPDKHCVTSHIVGKHGGYVVTASGTYYKLLDVDPAYAKQYPNAWTRVMASLKEM